MPFGAVWDDRDESNPESDGPVDDTESAARAAFHSRWGSESQAAVDEDADE